MIHVNWFIASGSVAYLSIYRNMIQRYNYNNYPCMTEFCHCRLYHHTVGKYHHTSVSGLSGSKYVVLFNARVIVLQGRERKYLYDLMLSIYTLSH